MSEKASEYDARISEIDTTVGKLAEGLGTAAALSADQILSPFDIRVKPLAAKRSNLEYLFPTVFVLVILFVAVLLGVTIMNKERSSRAHFRNFITPAPDWLFMFGTFITCLALTLVQVLVISLIGAFVFNVDIIGSSLGILCSVILAGSLFSMLGILLGSLLANEETTTLSGIIICMILFLFSGTVIPIESMSALPRFLVGFNPFYLFEDLFRRQLIFGASIIQDPYTLVVVLAEIAVLVAATVAAWVVIRRRL